MTRTKTITFAGRDFVVAPFPIHPNRDVYPICARLHNNGLVERSLQAGGALQATPEEMDDLAAMAFAVINWVDPEVTREVFETMLITPGEYLDAYFSIRILTGGWVEKLPAADPGQHPGEDQGSPSPPKRRRRK